MVAGADAFRGGDGLELVDAARIGCTCHGAASVNVVVTLEGLPVNYTPGQNYTVWVNLSGGPSPGGFNAGGFHLKVSAGQLWSLDSSVRVTPERRNATHTFAGNDVRTWRLNWSGPGAGTGDVRFWLASNSVNGDDGTNGDAWAFLNPGGLPFVLPEVVTDRPTIEHAPVAGGNADTDVLFTAAIARATAASVLWRESGAATNTTLPMANTTRQVGSAYVFEVTLHLPAKAVDLVYVIEARKGSATSTHGPHVLSVFLPNLRVVEVSTMTPPRPGEPTVVYAQIRLADGLAVHNITVRLAVEGILTRAWTLSLYPNYDTNVTVTWTPGSEGGFALTVEVDLTDGVLESNEDDNVAQTMLFVERSTRTEPPPLGGGTYLPALTLATAAFVSLLFLRRRRA